MKDAPHITPRALICMMADAPLEPQTYLETPLRGQKRKRHLGTGKRVSRAHETEYDELAPGRQRRQKKRVFGSVRDAAGRGT